MKQIKISIVLISNFVSCMTMQLNYQLRPKTIQESFTINSINHIEEVDKNTLKFNFPNQKSNVEYANCLLISYRSFTYCKPNEKNSNQSLQMIHEKDFYISNKKGFIYFDKDIAFIHSNLKNNFYDDSKGQFGFPKSIEISDDGESRFITYNKPRADLNDVCYYEVFNPKSNRFEFKSDCKNGKLKLHPMQKVKIKQFIYINQISDLGYFKVTYLLPTTNHSSWILLRGIEGKYTEYPSILWYLAYPLAILFDVFTFPIQIFVIPFGKTALG